MNNLFHKSKFILNAVRSSYQVHHLQIRERTVFRKPVRVNESTHLKNTRVVNEYLDDNKITIQPVSKAVEDLSEHFLDDSLDNARSIKFLKKARKKPTLKTKTNTDDHNNELFKFLKYKWALPADLNKIVGSKSNDKISTKTHFFVEGKNIIYDALRAGLTPQYIFFNDNNDLLDIIPDGYAGYTDVILALNNLPLYKTSYTKIKIWSDLVSPPGIMGIFELPQEGVSPTNRNRLPLTVILDGIEEYGNLGSIIRTLACVGVNSVLVMDGCCETWNSKTIRSSSGGHFFVNIIKNVKWSHLSKYTNGSEDVFLADICRPALKITSDSCNIRPFTTFTDKNEELNANQRDALYQALVESTEGEVIEYQEDGTEATINLTYNYPEHLEKYKDIRHPLVLYNNVNYFNNKDDEIILIITGEGGSSNSAKKFCYENQGRELYLDLKNNVTSLNTNVASAILVYEINRQHSRIRSLEDE